MENTEMIKHEIVIISPEALFSTPSGRSYENTRTLQIRVPQSEWMNAIQLKSDRYKFRTRTLKTGMVAIVVDECLTIEE
jgi:hypothetical protein